MAVNDGPLVGVVMGSDSDWPVMKAAAEALDEFEVRYEADVVFHGHAHYGTTFGRTPGGVPVYNVARPLVRDLVIHQI